MVSQPLHEPRSVDSDPGIDLGQRRVADPSLGHVDHPAGRHLIRRVSSQSQVGQSVADLPPVIETGSAHHPVGNTEANQLLLDGPALGIGAVEDRHVGPRVVAPVPIGGQPACDPAGLVDLVLGPEADDGLPGAGVGPKFLGFATRVATDHRVGGVQDGLGGTVVLVEHHDGGVRERLLELEDVADVCPSELVDRLVAVADHEDVAVSGRQEHHQVVLNWVGVLVLVDEYMLEALPVAVEDLGVGPQESHGVDQ